MKTRAVAVAHPNIALAKYWGKVEGSGNLPAVPSLSVTLEGMSTRTEVAFADGLAEDRLILDGTEQHGRALARVSTLLDLVWPQEKSGERQRALVTSDNDFPTAAGLASSASAFAALATAANEAMGAGHSPAYLSDLARKVSASAGRSLFGGFVVLPAGKAGQMELSAEVFAPAEHWDLRLVVAVTTEEAKKIGSTEGMNHTAATSPLYQAWLSDAPRLFERVCAAIGNRDFSALVPAVEQSALTMHAVAIAADPGLIYWNDATVRVMQRVREMRAAGLALCFTIDAGPHVKVITTEAQCDQVQERLASVDGVLRTIVARPGGGARALAASMDRGKA